MILDGPMAIQTFEMDLTPPMRLPLGGYTARNGKLMDEGGDPLKARFVRFKLGSKVLCLASLELLTIPESLVRDVRAKLPADANVWLFATHTHCAPDSQLLNDRMAFAIPGIAKFDPKQLEWYADRIAVGVKQTMASPAIEARALQVQTVFTELNRGRRPGAFPDPMATLVRDWQTQNPLFFTFAAHPVLYGSERNQTSGDWPGAIGAWIGAPVFVGAIGDVSPKAAGQTADARLASFRRTMIDYFQGSARKRGDRYERSIPVSSFRTAVEPIRLDAIRAHPDFAKSNRIPSSMADAIVQRFAPTQGSISAFRIGKLCVVGIPGEPSSGLGKRIRDEGRRIGFEHVLVLSHANGWIGYILEKGDYEKGGYEASLAFHGPETGQRTFESATRAMKALAFPARAPDRSATLSKV